MNPLAREERGPERRIFTELLRIKYRKCQVAVRLARAGLPLEANQVQHGRESEPDSSHFSRPENNFLASQIGATIDNKSSVGAVSSPRT